MTKKSLHKYTSKVVKKIWTPMSDHSSTNHEADFKNFKAPQLSRLPHLLQIASAFIIISYSDGVVGGTMPS